MSDSDTTTTRALAPADLSERFPILSAEASEIKEAIADNFPEGLRFSDLPRVKIPGSGGTRWVLDDETGEEAESIEGIIILHVDQRQYWEVSIDEGGGGTRPDCHSADGEVGVGSPGGECARCPLSQFGPDGERPKCAQRKVVFFLQSGQFLPTVINLPATNLRPLRQYFRSLVTRAKSYWKVVTRLDLQRVKSDRFTYSIVLPKVVDGGYLDPQAVELVRKYREAAGNVLQGAGREAAAEADEGGE